ncbi:putative monovalent cation/H+ antiporter subunit A [Oryzibacter oryziterrae]|uniref:putative monovalent cation/H+ antiporter subunit A n=1 Tax=Oryzibacter oryziterrae TaxID=2766474 RepID=UPI001F191948|nr:putative monovalent cation/H+ antiporter subunit A [Oryzibacter oryziterrae]
MTVGDWPLLAVALPFVAAALTPFVLRYAEAAAPYLLCLFPAAIFAAFAAAIPGIAAGQSLNCGIDWLPAVGIRLSVRVDGLSSLFALLISGIGTFIVLYAGAYMKGHPGIGRFFSSLFLFMGAMLGLVLADDLISLFVFWEGTSIASFLLIGFDHTRQAARRAAFQALVITGLGGLSLLAGVLLAGQIAGVHSLTELLASGEALRGSPLYPLVLALFLGAAFTKSAQMPLHVWLPNAMEAPTPVSAYLHSATMVKAGVYLLMRLNPVLGGTPAWESILPFVGGVTLIGGALLALRQTDLKLMLAQTTVASLGLLVMLIGLDTDAAIAGAVAYLLAHALFKGALFMVAGAIDHESGTRDIRRLGGLRRAMPVTCAAAALAGLSMAGIPGFFGFVAKETLYGALADLRVWAAIALAVCGNALMFAIAGQVALRPFLGAPRATPRHAHEGPIGLWAGPLVFGAKGLAIVLALPLAVSLTLGPAVNAVAGHPVDLTLHALPEHVELPLLLSLLTMALGVAAYLSADRLRSLLDTLAAVLKWGPDRGFDQAIAALLRLATLVTRSLQSGRLEAYITATMVLTALALLVPMTVHGEWPALPVWPHLLLHEWAIVAIAFVGLVAVLRARTRLTAIVSLGAQGFAVATLFMLFGAPDLAFTQFMVETLSVVILALVMTRLKLAERDHRPLGQKVIDGSIAGAAGLGFGALLLRVTQTPFDSRLSDFYEANSRLVAHGRNVVNVIIVDFRGLDTMGEIAVVMITGLAILALVRVRARIVIHKEDDRS